LDDRRCEARPTFPPRCARATNTHLTANQFDNRAFGWSSTKDRVGFWLLNPSVEFLSGGPTKTEFLAHRDTTPVAAPIVFNYWRSSHYGGALVEVGAGERWSKVIGPFFLYVNSGGDHAALAADARARQAKEAAQWPYEWVAGVDYARRAERAPVKGRLKLDDPHARSGVAQSARRPHARLHFTGRAPGFKATRRPPPDRLADRDARYYQFWARGEAAPSPSPRARGHLRCARSLTACSGVHASRHVVKTGQPRS
jgi:rhamnogalacturonan endolyase